MRMRHMKLMHDLELASHYFPSTCHFMENLHPALAIWDGETSDELMHDSITFSHALSTVLFTGHGILRKVKKSC